MEHWLNFALTVFVSVMGASGFWAYIQSKKDKHSATTQLLLGLAHDRIIVLATEYIERGSITKDEYDDLIHYLYGPYSNFGGNGLAKKMMEEVDRLPITRRRKPVTAPIMVQNKER